MAYSFLSDRGRADGRSRSETTPGRGAAPDMRMASLKAMAEASPPVRTLQAMTSLAAPAQLAASEEEEPLQGHGIQRAAVEEEEPLQGKGLDQAPSPRAARGGLPDPLRQGIESLSGLSMEGVRVHYNSAAPASVGAHAFARGQDIHLAPGQDRHLPHEAWHVVQQAQGQVAPTTEVNGVAVNDSPLLEQEADRMGAKAALIADKPARQR